jgi:hypothetical protein
MGFIMVVLKGVKIPPKSHGILRLNVNIFQFANAMWTENQTTFWEEFSCIINKAVGESSEFCPVRS